MNTAASSRRLEKILSHLHGSDRFLSNSNPSPLPNSTCGIVAFVSNKEEAWNFLIEGLTILENRGYDSAGIATIQNKEIVCTKFAATPQLPDVITRLKNHKKTHQNHKVGVGHTRWATHGGKTDLNAHPHCDQKGRIVIVHNGVITNAEELKKGLEEKSVVFVSETDTEVIAQLIGAELDEGTSILDAIKKTEAKLEGTWGVVVMSKDSPDEIYAFKNGSPLLVGISKGRMFVASESSAFSQYTKEYISLENGEIAVIRPDNHTLDLSRVEKAPEGKIEISPAPFPHWTLKEIFEQPEAISKSLSYGGRFKDESSVKLGGLDSNTANLKSVNHLVIAACGTSLHAASVGAILMRQLKSFETIQIMDAAEFVHDSLPLKGGALLVISQSGETKDVHRCLLIAQELNVPTFSIVNVVSSLIARTTKCGVYLNAGREHGVASTKAFTAQLSVIALVAVWFSQSKNTEESKRRMLIDNIHRFPISIGMALNSREICKRISQNICKHHSCFVLGKGLGEPVAREGALKIKEISYIHAEGTSGGALKHGPFALLSQGTPVFLIICEDQHAPFMKIAAEEVKARGAYTIVITNNLKLAPKKIADEVIRIPNNGDLTPLLAIIPLQFIAYETALLRGNNPDKPRNLAKAVTTD